MGSSCSKDPNSLMDLGEGLLKTQGDSEGQGSLVRRRPWHHRVRHDWATARQQHDTGHFHPEPSKSGVRLALTAYLSVDQPCLKCPLATYDQWLSSWATSDALVTTWMLTTRQTLRRGWTCIFLSVLRDFHYVNRKEKKKKKHLQGLYHLHKSIHLVGSSLVRP